ncbi:MAG: c-type cytochrome [Rubrivivax sp.]|nr:c-type cytochrome [Rubrivivax sp.]
MRTLIATLGMAAVGLGAVVPAQADPEANMVKAGCTACHTKDKKLVGPSYKDIAAKYKGQATAVATLTEKARAGGKGSFGPIPMPPNPVAKISDADLKAAVEWILKQ